MQKTEPDLHLFECKNRGPWFSTWKKVLKSRCSNIKSDRCCCLLEIILLMIFRGPQILHVVVKARVREISEIPRINIVLWCVRISRISAVTVWSVTTSKLAARCWYELSIFLNFRRFVNFGAVSEFPILSWEKWPLGKQFTNSIFQSIFVETWSHAIHVWLNSRQGFCCGVGDVERFALVK